MQDKVGRKIKGTIKDHILEILRLIGEDPKREGLKNTPLRVEKSLLYFTDGYRQNLDRILKGAIFEAQGYDEMMILRDIDFYSLCEHHLLPFFGKCHIAYLPDKKILGLSKLPRLVEVFSRRLQVQERLTMQIAQTIQQRIKPKGVGVVIDAYHLCMMMRGVEKQNTRAVTSAMLGRFRSDARTRAEFLRLIGER
jgi:GTP cyclohydrolase I